ncbi:MAG: hypothetical protein ACXABU_15955, partial [Candidatus Hodarchaeales archaeon]
MPHIVINGNIEILDIFKIIRPIFVKLDNEIIKSNEFYISKDKNSILIKTLSIEQENKISFFVLINNRDDGVVIRLYPEFDVPKTHGVKKSLVEIAY